MAESEMMMEFSGKPCVKTHDAALREEEEGAARLCLTGSEIVALNVFRCSCIQRSEWGGWGQRFGLGMYHLWLGVTTSLQGISQRPQMCVCRSWFAATGGLRSKGGVSRDLPHVHTRDRKVRNKQHFIDCKHVKFYAYCKQ